MSHDHAHSHQDLLQELVTELQPVLQSSEQAIYIYLDDEQKACNGNFASLLGYDSPEEWAKTEGSFPDLFVDTESQDTLIDAFRKAMQEMTASTIKVRWKHTSGGTAETTVILVPISFKNHLFALHFVS